MNHERANAVADIVRNLLERMTVSADVMVMEAAIPLQGEFVCHIHVTEGSNLLIGQRGLNLEALQTLARLAARRKLEGWADFSLDVNEYREKKGMALLEEAREAERQAHQDRRAVILRPMTAFERKYIHMALADSALATTESSGTGENRKIIVKPKGDF